MSSEAAGTFVGDASEREPSRKEVDGVAWFHPRLVLLYLCDARPSLVPYLMEIMVRGRCLSWQLESASMC